jgi:glycosyltransferase involved in cell wall biosynthesis
MAFEMLALRTGGRQNGAHGYTKLVAIGMSLPLVSAVIPCFNAEKTIARALASIRAQDYSSIEIIAIDDCSTDATAKILAAEEPRGVRLLRLQLNRGAAAARNAGIEAASGEYIAFLDADDEWMPNKISRQMAVISGCPSMTFVACGAGFIDIKQSGAKPLYENLAPADGSEAWRVLLAYNYVATPAVLARRSAIQRARGFDPRLIIGEDQDLWIRLALQGEIGYIPETLVIVHEQRTSLSRRNVLRLLDDSMPMILRHVREQRSRLSVAEVRNILGNRYTKIGRNAYLDFPIRGLMLVLKAILLGHRPLENAAYLLSASPIARWFKRGLLRRGAMVR